MLRASHGSRAHTIAGTINSELSHGTALCRHTLSLEQCLASARLGQKIIITHGVAEKIVGTAARLRVSREGRGAAQLDTVGLRAARRFPQDLFGSGGAQLLHLRVEALAVGRYPCIAVNHAGILLLYSAPEKPFFIKGFFDVFPVDTVFEGKRKRSPTPRIRCFDR
jgi:hypothetical protein